MNRAAMMLHHLQANHYPPVPASMVPVCLAVVDYYVSGGPDGLPLDDSECFDLPDGVTYRGGPCAPAEEIAEAHHLWEWIDWELAEAEAEGVIAGS